MPSRYLPRIAAAISLIFAGFLVCQCGWWPIVDHEFDLTPAYCDAGFVHKGNAVGSAVEIALNDTGDSIALSAKLMECPDSIGIAYRLVVAVSPVYRRDLSKSVKIRFSDMHVTLAHQSMKFDRDGSEDGAKIRKWQWPAYASFDLLASDQLCPGNDTLLNEDPCLVFEFDSVFQLGDNYVNVEPIFARPPQR